MSEHESPPPTSSSTEPIPPQPTTVEPAGEGTPGSAGEEPAGKVPTWLVVAIVAVVLLVVAAVVGVLVLGGDDDGGGASGVEGSLPAQVSTEDADTPVVQMLTDTQWDLDGSAVTTSFGNTCTYQGPESFLACTLIGGDPSARRDLEGADLANRTEAGDPVEPAVEVVGEAEQVGSGFTGCPGSIRLQGVDERIGPGPALCVLTDQQRVFAVYLTHVAPEGALSFVAVEVTP